ncbi:3-keto-5-aminohexanoate cleavage protein [Shimia sp. MMG029]|uniref:3-keto-5-aminohexanoate cleavage protein n=1 Tax=Shimia sp. MMG029 TaxID=3021978 RepID=UPI0022FEB8E5|nr:3-keto-5-aminohexanoate cleavage protein [Shimia sp. MMG029]MDA5556646.1 3-keto-5-aminohexanoate cleavage protein [Shimia sp. MMG029]
MQPALGDGWRCSRFPPLDSIYASVLTDVNIWNICFMHCCLRTWSKTRDLMTDHLSNRTLDWQTAEPLKITVAPNGARRGRIDHPALPITTDQIALTAQKCAIAGADEIHLHVRTDAGKHSLDAQRYREAMAAIAKIAPELSVQITTESAGIFDVKDQFDVLKSLVPDAASISVREMARDERLAREVYAFVREANVYVQHILYSYEDIDLLATLQASGQVERSGCDVLLVLGRYAPPRLAEVSELAPFVSAVANVADRWTVCAFGKNEQAVAEEAIRLGGHVRIGFENNIHRPDGSLAEDNAENIRPVVNIAHALGRPLLKETAKS